MILVTGGTGKVGTGLVKQLSSLSAPFKVMARDPAKAKNTLGANVEVVQGDLANPGSLDAAMKGVDTVFLLSPVSPAQVEHQSNAIQAAKRAGVKRVVKLSSVGATPSSPMQFGRWHAQTEQELQSSGMQWTFLRPHYFMQTMLGGARTIIDQGMMFAPLGDAKISLVDTRDVAAVAARVLVDGAAHVGKAYDVTGPESLGYQDIANKIGKHIGKTVTYVNVPSDKFREALLGAGFPDWLADDITALMVMFSKGDHGSISNATRDVGKATPHTYDDFLRDYGNAFKG